MEGSSLTTAGLSEGRRVAFWTDIVCEMFVELDCRVPTPQTFHGRIDRLGSGGLDFCHVRSSAHVVSRTRARIARSTQDDYLLSLQTGGRGLVSQDGREAVLEPGDFTIYDTTRPYDLRFDDEFSQLVLRLPRRLVTTRLAEADVLTARRVAGDRGLGRLTSSFLRQLHAELADVDPVAIPRLNASAVDLVAAAMADQALRREGTSECRILLRRRISSYIDRNLADPHLTCASVAEAHGMSARHLRKVFEDAPTGVSELIWTRRLEQARRDLADPLHAHVSVTSVGYDAGFKDAAHFSRAFKAAYGETPTTCRRRSAARSLRGTA